MYALDIGPNLIPVMLILAVAYSALWTLASFHLVCLTLHIFSDNSYGIPLPVLLENVNGSCYLNLVHLIQDCPFQVHSCIPKNWSWLA